MCENKIKYHLFIMPLIWILILNAILFGDPGETCNEAVDYGLINGDTIISGNFDSEGEDYWIKFSTSCVFRDVTISSCGSFVSEDEWLDTFLEVYSDLDSGSSACEEFEPYNILIGEEPNTPWWNDDPPQNLQCNFNNENLPEQYHAVLVIPTAQEQAINVQIQPGTYYLRVSTYPGNNQVGDWQVSISGRATVAPNVEDQYLELPHNPSDGSPGGSMTVELDASESLCIEQIAIYEWFEDDISIAGPTSDINQYVSLDYGDHNLHLNITDLVGTNYQESFMVSISEPNSNPVSDAGESQFITVPHDGSPATNVITVTLLGDSSNDLDGDDLTFNWEKITGPDDMALSDTQAENPTFNTFNTFGSSSKEYEFKLTVADPYQTLDIDTTSVTIYAEENIIPIASASDLQINILHDGDPSTFNSEEFTLNGSASYDLDGDNITSYMWFDSELDTLSEIAYYTGALNYSTIDSVLGDHTFTLVVVDSYDEVGNTSITLTVGPELNSAPIVLFDPPIAEFMMNPDDNPGGFQMVVLDVYNASFDPDNYDSEGNELPDELKTDEIVSEWFDADGNPALPLQNLSAGQSSFTLRVTDSYGASSESIFNVLISEPNAVPSAITNGYEEFYESTVDLNEDGDLTKNAIKKPIINKIIKIYNVSSHPLFINE